MKMFFIILVTLFILSCNQQKTEVNNNTKTVSNFPEGNWELVSNVVNGKEIKTRRTQQFKMFHDGYYSFIMYDSSGAFYFAGAGPYEVEDNIYKENFAYSSDTTYLNYNDWQRWELKGDTLIFYGFEKVLSPAGKDETQNWGGSKFIEKRVRVKSNINIQ